MATQPPMPKGQGLNRRSYGGREEWTRLKFGFGDKMPNVALLEESMGDVGEDGRDSSSKARWTRIECVV